MHSAKFGVILILSCAACVSDTAVRSRVLSVEAARNSNGPAVIEAWLSWPGDGVNEEVQLSLAPRTTATVPRPCLTAVVMGNNDPQLQNTRVRVRGMLVPYESLPLRPVGALEDRFYGHRRVFNWCYSNSLLLVEEITPLQAANALKAK